jgi:hypothetical protein
MFVLLLVIGLMFHLILKKHEQMVTATLELQTKTPSPTVLSSVTNALSTAVIV